MFNDSYTPPRSISTAKSPRSFRPRRAPNPPCRSTSGFTPMPSIRPHGRSTLTTMRRSGSLPRRAIPSRRGPAPDFEAYYSKESGTYGMKVSSPTLMVVVTDPVNQLYAYSQQEVEIVEGGQPVNFLPVVFRPWKQEYLYVEEGGWRVVNDKLAPKEPEKSKQEITMQTRKRNILRLLRAAVLLLFATAFLSRCASMMTPHGRSPRHPAAGHPEHDARQLLGQPAHRASREDLHRIRRVRAAQGSAEGVLHLTPR